MRVSPFASIQLIYWGNLKLMDKLLPWGLVLLIRVVGRGNVEFDSTYLIRGSAGKERVAQIKQARFE
jgi:hypothetical protein